MVEMEIGIGEGMDEKTWFSLTASGGNSGMPILPKTRHSCPGRSAEKSHSSKDESQESRTFIRPLEYKIRRFLWKSRTGKQKERLLVYEG